MEKYTRIYFTCVRQMNFFCILNMISDGERLLFLMQGPDRDACIVLPSALVDINNSNVTNRYMEATVKFQIMLAIKVKNDAV